MVIRRSKNPPAKTIGRCRHYNTQQDLDTLNEPRSQAKYLVSCILDVCMFNSGALSRVYIPEHTFENVLEGLAKVNETAVSVHANYISGNKKKMLRMQEHNLWLADIHTVDADILKQTRQETRHKEGVKSNKNDHIYRCKPYVPLPANWKYPEVQPIAEQQQGK